MKNSLYIAMHLIKKMLGTKTKILMLLVIPCMILLTAIVFIDADISEILSVKGVYIDEDNTLISEYLLTQTIAKTNISWEPSKNISRAKDSLAIGEIHFIIYIPPYFTRDNMSGDLLQPTLYVSDQTKDYTTIQSLLQQQTSDIQQAIQATKEDADVSNELSNSVLAWLNEQQNKDRELHDSITFHIDKEVQNGIIFGYIAMFITISSILYTSSIVEELKNKTVSRLFYYPIKHREITLGYFLGAIALGVIQVLLFLTITTYLFRYDFGISFFLLFFISFTYLLAMFGMTAAIASFVKTRYLTVVQCFIFIPACMIGGCHWPTSSMPPYLQNIAFFLPETWATNAVHILSSTNNIGDVKMHLLNLILFAIVLLTTGSMLLKPDEISLAKDKVYKGSNI